MNHYNIPEIYSDLLVRLFDDDWKRDYNDYFVAAVRLANKLHHHVKHDIDSGDNILPSNIIDEMSFLDITDESYLHDLVKAVSD